MYASNCIKKLLINKNNIKKYNIKDLFAIDKLRFEHFSHYFNGILFDFSNQHINKKTIKLLVSLAEARDVKDKILDLFKKNSISSKVDTTNMHVYMRNFFELQRNDLPCWRKIKKVSESLNQGKYTIYQDLNVNSVISLGIGGSHIGHLMGNYAFKKNYRSKCTVYSISSLDSKQLIRVLLEVNLKRTICIINSKSFTTMETINNANILKSWFKHNKLCFKKHFFAITSKKNIAFEFGIDKKNIFSFDEGIGGRYSISAFIGFTLCINIGYNNFKKLLDGFNIMDNHFKNMPLNENIPFLMGSIGFWNNNINNFYAHSLISYSSSLKYFVKYLQQLEMESNGKLVNNNYNIVNYRTSPIIWGGTGPEVQHTFMQFLHHNNQVSPVDFIIPVKNIHFSSNMDKLNIFSVLSQIKSLAEGSQRSNGMLYCPGNRPSTALILNDITYSTIGCLMACYEHKIYIQSILWQTNAFDQQGVELGKKNINNISQTNLEYDSYVKSKKKKFHQNIFSLMAYARKFFL